MTDKQILDRLHQWKPGDLVFHPLLRCPACSSADVVAYKSQRQGDGSALRWTRCRKCEFRFKVVLQ